MCDKPRVQTGGAGGTLPLMRFSSFVLLAATLSAASAQTPVTGGAPTVADAKAFLDRANADLLKAAVDGSHAEWLAETYINEDSEATTALLNEQGSTLQLKLIEESHRFDKLDLPAPMRRQMMLLQVNAPAAPHDPKLLAEETQLGAQLTGMYGKGKFCPTKAIAPNIAAGHCMSVDEVDTFLAKSRDPQALTEVWSGWHAVGAPMRDRYTRLIELQNVGAREQNYKDAGELWRAGYDMTPAQFTTEVNRAWTQLEPLYRELHTYVRRRLIAKYGAAADRKDGMIPAQLLGNTWAQEWGNIYDIVGPTDPKLSQFKPIDLEASLIRQIGNKEGEATRPYFQCESKDAGGADAAQAACGSNSDVQQAAHTVAAKDMVHYGENFFTSLGFAPLPKTFWDRSQFVHPRDRDVVCHASAWDINQVDDLRVKMCIEVNADYFTVVHHELGHNFYQRAYDKQPMLFRNGANDGFHEAIGDSIALSITPAYLKSLGLADAEPPAEADIPLQLRTALDKVAFLPFALALDTWRWQVFSGEIKPAEYNKAWWALRAKYQGVAPPVERTESDFDPGAKNHIPTNVPYARYFLARIYQFQFYKAMCDASGYKGPLNRCSFYGSKAAGAKLNAMLETGQSQPWQQTLKAMTGTDHLDAQPMIDYFAPLYTWLKQQNAAAK